MELRLPNEVRLLAGVHLERRSEPAVDLTPFVVTGLADATALQDILLERAEVDSVPELSQLREQVGRLGGRLHTYSTAKEYFGALFDYDVMPLRLATDEERTKFNELLRTSMMGGISRALTTDLRGFLLREETGLADTLMRMRANLDACRRTRTEVEESRKLEHEISIVYEAGHEMFAAAVHATREREQELHGRVLSAQDSVRDCEDRAFELSRQFEDAKLERDRLTNQLTELRPSLQSAREHLGRLEQAQKLLKRIHDREAGLAQANQAREEAENARSSSEHWRDSARVDRDESQFAREQAAEGLADLKRGLEELERRAAEHVLVSENFAKAKDFYPALDSQPQSIIQTILDVDRRRSTADSDFISVDQALSTLEERRNEYNEVITALCALRQEDVSPEKAFDCGREILTHLRQLETQVKEAEQLPSEINKASELANRQRRVRDMANGLQTAELSVTSQDDVDRALAAFESRLHNFETHLRDEERNNEDAERVARIQDERIKTLEIALTRWKEVRSVCQSLEGEWQSTVRTRIDILHLRNRIIERRDTERLAAAESEIKRVGLHQQVLGLEQSGGTFSPKLLRVRDAVEGELLAGQFEEINADEAPAVEALLGPLAQAIVVDDPRSACEVISNIPERPSSVWVVGGDAALDLDEQGRPTGEVLDGSVVVRSTHGGWRVTSFPERPTLGRRARERRVAELREEEAAAAIEVDRHQSMLHHLGTSLTTTDQLLASADLLEKGDPSPELEGSRRIALDAAQRIERHRELRNRFEADIELVRPICRDLRKIAPYCLAA
jgi:chromosome partition protein MukB